MIFHECEAVNPQDLYSEHRKHPPQLPAPILRALTKKLLTNSQFGAQSSVLRPQWTFRSIGRSQEYLKYLLLSHVLDITVVKRFMKRLVRAKNN